METIGKPKRKITSTGRRRRDWKSCRTFGQKVGHIARQIPKVVLPVAAGYALVKGLKKPKMLKNKRKSCI
jgi:hypothetical protein|tara:strand:- start:45 stop:254 length:210 start_codon:yes stop_codon:yes gene_type:complete